jgi:hypothetical protein
MKQIYVMTSALLVAISTQAQFQTIDFEEFTLPSVDTFYNGADGAGQFISQDVVFNNVYEEFSWGASWSGFAYSNMTDNTTAGFSNQYSSFAGEGANGSENYAIYYAHDTLEFPGIGAEFGNVAITNTSYAGISMRDGDMFAKEFGSPNNAAGEPDGTNGEDFFYVTFRAWDEDWNYLDSVDIYLADFTSSDANDHYILEAWENFDLSALNGAKYLTFDFKSSDMGEFGINTPVYFAMDNLEFSEIITATDGFDLALGVYPNPTFNMLNVKGENGHLTLLDNAGRTVWQGRHNQLTSIEVYSLPKGIYFIHLRNKNGSATQKVVVQ